MKFTSSISFTVALFSGAAQALPLIDTSISASPWLAGPIIEERTESFDYLTTGVYADEPFSFRTSGSVHSSVVRSATDGSIDFYWQIALTSGALMSMRLSNFATALPLKAGWRNDSHDGLAPPVRLEVEEGETLFSFSELFLGEGESGALYTSSRSFFLDTAATAYTTRGSYSLDSSMTQIGIGYARGISRLFSTFAPQYACKI